MTAKVKYLLSMLFAGATVLAAWVGFGLISAHLIAIM